MSIVTRFTSPGLTAAKYDEIVKRLAAAGAGSPEGRQFHVCFGDKDNLRVSDIWESRQLYDTFIETLKPIMQDLSIEPGEVETFEVHNLIAGARAVSAIL